MPYFGAELLADSSVIGSADASSGTAAGRAEVCGVDKGTAGASEPAFGFSVLDFSRGPWLPELTLIFRHLSYPSTQ